MRSRGRCGRGVDCEWLKCEDAGARVGARAPAAVGSPGFRDVGFVQGSIVRVPCLREPRAASSIVRGAVVGSCVVHRSGELPGRWFKGMTLGIGRCEDDCFWLSSACRRRGG